MILLFLGSWRSTLIVCISIPLSILASLCILSLLGQTINVMTLGGLALAVGILVDDATVEIENTHRNMAMSKPLVRAVLDGASQIAVPTFVSTLSICIVFVPVCCSPERRDIYSRRWPWRSCSPCSLRICFRARWSRPWWPTCLKPEVDYIGRATVETKPAAGLFWRVHHLFNALFERSALPLRGPARLVAATSRPRSAGFHGVFPSLRWGCCGWWARISFPMSIPAR